MRQKRFLSRALSLGIYTLILRAVNTVFGIWMSNTVGAEGTGLFQLVSSVYFLAVTFSTSGVTIAVTRIVSEQLAKGSPAGARKAFRLGLLFSLILGVAASFLLFFAAPAAAAYWLCDPRNSSAHFFSWPSVFKYGLCYTWVLFGATAYRSFRKRRYGGTACRDSRDDSTGNGAPSARPHQCLHCNGYRIGSC